MPTSPAFVYRSALFVNGTGAEKRVVFRIAGVEMSFLYFGTFYKTVYVDLVKRLTFNLFIEECNGRNVLIFVPKTMIKK